jgi:thiol-disulfide isomerase/thioredoxin
MNKPFPLSCVCLALALTSGFTEQHAAAVAVWAHAAPFMRGQIMRTIASSASSHKTRATTQTHKANSKGNPAPGEAPEVREMDLETLKKLLQRGTEGKARPLLINFWATWCEPCREEFPDLVRIHADYGKRNLDFITITLDEPDEIKTKVPAFLREMRAPMPTYLLNIIDPQLAIDAIDPSWHGGLPATFLYDASGKQVFRHTGRVDARELRAALDKVTTVK